MKKVIFYSFILAVLSTGCVKTDNVCNYSSVNVEASAIERNDIRNYLASQGQSATEHPSGFFYTITTEGTGEAIANLCSQLKVSYVGTLTNGSRFDGSTNASLSLHQTILAWQTALPLIRTGGKMRLIIPPSLGYGNQDVRDANGGILIPKNSILIFDIELLEVNNL